MERGGATGLGVGAGGGLQGPGITGAVGGGGIGTAGLGLNIGGIGYTVQGLEQVRSQAPSHCAMVIHTSSMVREPGPALFLEWPSAVPQALDVFKYIRRALEHGSPGWLLAPNNLNVGCTRTAQQPKYSP
jgi:hypothetical protein